ncbi:hypothetical protein PGTUg99_036725 [Puccinia graminis f. sp. tritici]|uniref:Uncharacterized protein n=1 Tax=Puccinia graminis f. sp. tritici TaxID=56615 RepID=A0A5B0PQ63_PUCGR|nr:hypothetical protein PGTUg99_036725 [Puccinia graminis f. sp. tritici]
MSIRGDVCAPPASARNTNITFAVAQIPTWSQQLITMASLSAEPANDGSPLESEVYSHWNSDQG